MANVKWTLDPAHSELQFKIKHLMITNVTGSFGDFTASLESEGDDFENAHVTFEAAIDSINTGNADRDAHLKAGDFFEIEKYPKMTFESTAFRKDGSDYTVQGNLTLKGVTRPVTLEAEFGGISQDPWGNTKAGFSVSGKIKREDFGLTYNAALETGGVMLGNDVKIFGEVQFVKQA
ncbi:hypothetical protein C7T94_01310 [Pedobacter yulinensis]|uniref:Lipid/polyisoprenoid-binding YceI-like domain-containing protein n=1 Tax=Pedobacter yulinensis TaxID=2126353 RepID=A0A2T3HQR8_9SPHI|nr:YceI family protein [Pedobacter yulinensis]PST84792.1 hypothetical protein C7T94_01310 [Pedobacter yulinensis]